MPDYSVEQELVQFGEGSLTFLEPVSGQLQTVRELIGSATLARLSVLIRRSARNFRVARDSGTIL